MPLLDTYGEGIFRAAVAEVLAGTSHDHHGVAVACEKLRRKADKPVPLDVPLGSHVNERDVIPHSLEASAGFHSRNAHHPNVAAMCSIDTTSTCSCNL